MLPVSLFVLPHALRGGGCHWGYVQVPSTGSLRGGMGPQAEGHTRTLHIQPDAPGDCANYIFIHFLHIDTVEAIKQVWGSASRTVTVILLLVVFAHSQCTAVPLRLSESVPVSEAPQLATPLGMHWYNTINSNSHSSSSPMFT